LDIGDKAMAKYTFFVTVNYPDREVFIDFHTVDTPTDAQTYVGQLMLDLENDSDATSLVITVAKGKEEDSQ
jgi:hypothetical protein